MEKNYSANISFIWGLSLVVYKISNTLLSPILFSQSIEGWSESWLKISIVKLLLLTICTECSFLWCNNLSQICYKLHWLSSCFLLIIYQSIYTIGCRIQTNNTHILTLLLCTRPGEKCAHREPESITLPAPFWQSRRYKIENKSNKSP